MAGLRRDLYRRMLAEQAQLADGLGYESISFTEHHFVADTAEEAMALWADSGVFCGRECFEPFGFSKENLGRALSKAGDRAGAALETALRLDPQSACSMLAGLRTPPPGAVE